MSAIPPDFAMLQMDVKIFSNVKYYTSGNVSDEIIKLLEDGGAQRLKYFSDFVSHVICGSSGVRESDLSDADDVYEIPAVSERWVSTCARSKTLVNTKGFLYTDKNLFSSLVVTTSGLLLYDRNAIWAMVTYNGGVYRGAMDGVTHLVCTSVKCPKYQLAQSQLGQVTVVTPDWIVECLKMKALVPHEQYHPRRMIPLKPPSVQSIPSDTSRITGFEVDPCMGVGGAGELGGGGMGVGVEEMDDEEAKKHESLRRLWKQMPWNQKVFGDPSSATSPPRSRAKRPQQGAGATSAPSPGRAAPASTPVLTPLRSTTPTALGQYQYVQSPQQGPPQQQQQMQMPSPQGMTPQMMPQPSPQSGAAQAQMLQSPQHILQSPQHMMPSPQQVAGQGQNESSFLYKYIEQHMQDPKKGPGQPHPQKPLQQGQGPMVGQMQQVQQLQQTQQAPTAQQTAFLQQIRQRQQQKQAQLQQQQQSLQQQQQQQAGLPQVQGMQQVQMQQQLQQPLQQQLLQQQQQQQPQATQSQQQMNALSVRAQQQQQIQMLPSGQHVLVNPNQHQQLLMQQQQQQKMFNQQQQQQMQQQMQVVSASPTQQSQQQPQQQPPNLLQQNLLVQQQAPLQQQPQGMIQQKIGMQQPQQMFMQPQQQQQQAQVMIQPQAQQQALQPPGMQPQQQQVQMQGFPQAMQPQQQPQGIPQLMQQQQGQIVSQPPEMMQHVVTQQTIVTQAQQQSGVQPQMQQQIQPMQLQQAGMLQQQQQGMLQQQQQQLMSPPPQQQMLQQQVQGQVQGQPNMTPPQQLQQLQSPQGQMKMSIMNQQMQPMQGVMQQQVVMSQAQQLGQGPGPAQQQANLILGQQQFNKVQFAAQQQQPGQHNLQQVQQVVQQGQALLQGPQQQPQQFIKQGNFQPKFVQQQQQQVPGAQGPGQAPQFGVPVVQTQPPAQFAQQPVQQGVQQVVSGPGAQQLIAQSPTQAAAGPPRVWQQQVIQQVRQAVPGGPQVAGARVAWPSGQPHPQRQYIQLDAQTHQQLQQMAPEERIQFVNSLRAKQRQLTQRQLIAQQQQQQQQRAPGGHIVVRAQVPPGLTPQQHVQWLQQQQQQHKQVVVQAQGQGQPGLSPIQQAQSVGGVGGPQGQFDQAQIRPPLRVHQLQLQREQVQAQGALQAQAPGQLQAPPIQGQAQLQQGPALQGAKPMIQQQQQQQLPAGMLAPAVGGQPQPLDGAQFARGKTALANMLSIKLSGGQAIAGESLQEPSAAGTLRLMTAQHNAALNNNSSRAQEMLALQQQQQQQAQQAQQQQQQPQRRLNAGQMVGGEQVRPQGVVGVAPGVPAGAGQAQAGAAQGAQGGQPDKMFSPRSVLPIQHRPGTYYGHNPNLKLPPELFLLGCIFVVVEIEDFLSAELPDWARIVEKHGGELEKQYCSRITHVLCRSQRHGVVMQAMRDFKRCVTVHWLNDVIERRQVLPPWMALHLPALNLDCNPASKHLISLTGFAPPADRERVKTMIEAIGAGCTTYFSQHNTVLVAAKLGGAKCAKAKQWGTPVVNVQWLTEVMLGNFAAFNQTEHVKYQQYGEQANFCFDPSLVPTLMQPWKMPINISQESYERVKRSASPVALPRTKKIKTEHSDATEKPKADAAEQTDAAQMDATYRVFISSRCGNRQELKDIVIQLGGALCTDSAMATHFVVAKLYLTYNLLRVVCRNAQVVTEAWLHESRFAQRFVAEAAHAPDAKDFNQQYRCDFNLTLGTANRHRLLEGREFYVTPSVPLRRSLVACIAAAGGAVEKVRRSAARIEAGQASAPFAYVIVADQRDLHLVGDLLKRENKIVCGKEVLTFAILKQTFEIEPYLLRVGSIEE